MESQIQNAIARLKCDPSYSAYAAVSNLFQRSAPDASGLGSVKIAVLRNFTFDPLVSVISGEVALAGYHPQFYVGEYDSIAADVFDSKSSLYRFSPNFIIIGLWLENLTQVLTKCFVSSLDKGTQKQEMDRVVSDIFGYIKAIRENSNAPILINNFPILERPTLGILDIRSNSFQGATLLELNRTLAEGVLQFKDVYVVDYFTSIALLGAKEAIDNRYWHMGRAPISKNALIPLGKEYGAFIRSLKGKARKCLVLDCDNTLWGGVVGEDGIKGIQMGTNYPGSCYLDFQQEVINLHDRGILLAVCSKNNELDVLEVFRTHSEMLLKEKHISNWQVNWNDKATNILKIAEELNIGLDSLVFVDDSKFECDLVREKLPEVTVIQLPESPVEYRRVLKAGLFFDSLAFSDEDRKRTEIYQGEMKRKALKNTVVSLEEYLHSLEIVAEITTPSIADISRVAQLTQKTNQFNLTTIRYSEGQIQSFVGDSNSSILCLRLKDKVGDMGIVAVAITKYFEDFAEIDSFLMSCRALGRGVEDALMSHVLTLARQRLGCQRIFGKYIKTSKNQQVADYYKRNGFRVKEGAESSETIWELELDKDVYLPPAWVTLVTNDKSEERFM